MTHFPADFPLEALAVLAPVVRTGKVGDKVAAGEAAWNLLGFGMAQVLAAGPEAARAPGPKAPKKAAAPRAPTRAAATKALGEMESTGSVPAGAEAAPFDRRKFAENALKVARFVLPLLLGL